MSLFGRRSERRFTFLNSRSEPLPFWLEPWAEEFQLPAGARLDLVLTGAGAKTAEAPFELFDGNLCFYAPGATRAHVFIDGALQESGSTDIDAPTSGRLTTRNFVGLVFSGAPEARPGGQPVAEQLEAERPSALDAPMSADGIALTRYVETDREELRAACAQDQEVWEVYPYSMLDGHFDPGLDSRLAKSDWIVFTIRRGEQVVGTSCYIGVDLKNRTLEVGGTYYVPAERGTGLNATVKRLLLDRAFGSGFTRVQFNIDTRNSRSMRAVEKIGAVREGILRRNRVTWTGYVRDTAVYSILAEEWRARG